MAEFRTLEFPNTSAGQDEKIRTLQLWSQQGWKVVSETITPGRFRGQRACCLFLIFAPCAFLAGHTEGTITVTLQREDADRPPLPPLQPTKEISREEALQRARAEWGSQADVQTSGSEKIVGVVGRKDGRDVLFARGRGATWAEALFRAGLR